MIKEGNKPVLFSDVSCKFQIWGRALVIVSSIINTQGWKQNMYFYMRIFCFAVCHGTLVEKGWVIESWLEAESMKSTDS
jgi:hypothetical protein